MSRLSNELTEKLFKAENTKGFSIIYGDAKPIIKDIVKDFFEENINDEFNKLHNEISKLEAKVYVYENCISNSNFKNILDYKKVEEEK